MTVAVQYQQRPNISLAAGEVLGIDVAITSFLRAWFRYGQQEQFICQAADSVSFDQFKALAQKEGIVPERCIGLNPTTPQHNLANLSCIFRPDPDLSNLAWQRQQLKTDGFAACGLVHTMTGADVCAAVANLCLAPTESSDALICPSRAIRDVVLKYWEHCADYYNHRFNGNFHCPIGTPVIPLGIDTEKFAHLSTPDKRQAQRNALGAAEDEIVILFVGRLSFVTKAHPLPLLLAAEKAAQRCKRKLRLVFYGYYKPAEMEQQFHALCKDVCKTVRVDFIKNDNPSFPDGLWAAADIFASLSDNIQESFGLTPVEAMACGLPLVVTDWDGYRDAMSNGVEGYFVDTWLPPAEAGVELAEHYFNECNYGTYLVSSSQSTAIDIDGAAQAFVTLAEDETKRQAMGAAGRVRARDVYDWRHVIPTYEAVWAYLADQRKSQKRDPATPPQWQAAHVNYPNPWEIFSSFPSQRLATNDFLQIALSEDEITHIFQHEMNFFTPEFLCSQGQLRSIINTVRLSGGVSISSLLVHIAPQEQARLWRSLGWLLKHGLCKVKRKQ